MVHFQIHKLYRDRNIATFSKLYLSKNSIHSETSHFILITDTLHQSLNSDAIGLTRTLLRLLIGFFLRDESRTFRAFRSVCVVYRG